jgi:hypothetical protein
VYKILLGNSSMTQVVFGSGLPLMACRFLLVATRAGNPTIFISKVHVWGSVTMGGSAFWVDRPALQICRSVFLVQISMGLDLVFNLLFVPF